MCVRRSILNWLVVAVIGLLIVPQLRAAINDREYQMGDDDTGPPADGATVNITFDSAGESGMNQLVDLNAIAGPVYRAITGRPDGGSGLGIEFDGSQSQYLRGSRLGLPSDSFSSIGGGAGTLNYNGIADRGLQFWANPAATTTQTLVMDTNQHGVRINSSGNFSMRYDDEDFDSGVSAATDSWFHISVVRPLGAAGGARMYIDGVAVAAAPDGYDDGDTADLVVGANTAGDDQNFAGGTEEFYSGIIDDLKLFVIGDNSADAGPPPGQDWGAYNLAADNDFAVSTLSGVPGDVNNDGVLDGDDKNDFIAGWFSENLVDEIRIGDLVSLGNGDLNFDGITDISDLAEMQKALTAGGVGAITADDLNGTGVPEPSSGASLLVALAFASVVGRRGRHALGKRIPAFLVVPGR